jgi:hypothetical protein
VAKCLSPPVALTLSSLGLPDAFSLRYPALFAFGDKPSLFAHSAQNTTPGHFLAETLEQVFLRFSLSKHYSHFPDSLPSLKIQVPLSPPKINTVLEAI